MATLKESTDDLLKGFYKYCENNTECERICTSEINERCLAQYIVKTFKLYDYKEEKEENDNNN
jgi:hypothetical protein